MKFRAGTVQEDHLLAMRSLVLRSLFLAIVVLLAIGITAVTAARAEHFDDPYPSDSPEARAEAAAAQSEVDPSAPTMVQPNINDPTVFNGDSMYAQNQQGTQGGDSGGDPLFRLLSALALTTVDRPSLPQVVNEPVSASPAGLSTDQPLRPYLGQASAAVTDWKSLAEHALLERDMYRTRSENMPLPAFTPNDLVLDPTQRWRVPEQRAPVCIVSSARAAKVCPGTDQSSLIGTLLTDARHTSVGSIMPKFEFHQID